MIRKLLNGDIDRVADIWLKTNLKAHYFISNQYWKSNYELVKEMLSQSEVYVQCFSQCLKIGSHNIDYANQKKNSGAKNERSLWLPYAIGSALFAALTSILTKVGISNVESNLGTAIRTGVVLAMAWIIVFMKGKQSQVKNIDKTELVMLSRLVDTFFSRTSWTMLPYVENHSISVA